MIAVWCALLCCPLMAADGQELAAEPVAAAVDLTEQLRPLSAPQSDFLGSLSCSAVACHGGPRPGVLDVRAERSHEHLLWLERDPHARAGLSLAGAPARRMLERLAVLRDGRILDPAAYANCLACHSPSAMRAGAEPLSLAQGVDCESCHGPARRWIARHYRRDWNRTSGPQLDMIATSDLLTRARLCADCHVGSRDREVNHDLIAAGHPVLRFEMRAYHNALPKHWRETEQRDQAAVSQPRLWWAGQLATADAALALLAARADADRTRPVWPEFAEYNCGSCHHDLAFPTARTAGDRPQVAGWGDWTYWFLREPETGGDSLSRELRADLMSLTGQLEEEVTADRARCSSAAARAHRTLTHWIAQQEDRLAPARVRGLVNRLSAAGIRSREQAAQIYLAILANGATNLRLVEPGDYKAGFESLRGLLARPRWFAPPQPGDEPAPIERFRTQLSQLLEEG